MNCCFSESMCEELAHALDGTLGPNAGSGGLGDQRLNGRTAAGHQTKYRSTLLSLNFVSALSVAPPGPGNPENASDTKQKPPSEAAGRITWRGEGSDEEATNTRVEAGPGDIANKKQI